jgi:hypothetical protein
MPQDAMRAVKHRDLAEKRTLPTMLTKNALFALLLSISAWFTSSTAQAFAVGGHVGLNLDQGDVHVGADLLFPLTELSPAVQLGLWPSFAHVFKEGHDVELLGVDLPFLFRIGNAPLIPFVGPGLGLAIYEDVSLKLNVITGAFLETNSPVRPFGELALRFINGVFVDLLFGVVIEL